MSDTARCPFCNKYIDVTFKLESCPKCHKSLAGIELKNEVIEGHKMATLYGLWAAIAFLIISITVVGGLGNWLGISGGGQSIGVGILIGTISVYYFVDNYFSTK
jgi:phage FluMu protein Com